MFTLKQRSHFFYAKQLNILLAFIFGFVLALGFSACLGTVQPAFAATAEKHPIPAIEKTVSMDGTNYSDECTASAGSIVLYRVSATMADTVEKDYLFQLAGAGNISYNPWSNQYFKIGVLKTPGRAMKKSPTFRHLFPHYIIAFSLLQ